ncbi:MAG: DUF4388 domain-containing protein [Candidatus Promineifilaceae bacterium]
MLAKGMLGEISLPALLRTVNAEVLTGMLTIWHRKYGEGVIFFNKGDAVLANVNGRRGQMAIYEMSRWEDATFRLSQQGLIPQGQDATPLLNGAFKTDISAVDPSLRQRLFGTPLGTNNTENEQHDLVLETELIALLSNLESGMRQTQRWFIRRRPGSALDILNHMLNDTIMIGEAVVHGGLQTNRVVAMAHNIYPEVPLPQVVDNLFLPDALQMLYFTLTSRNESSPETLRPYISELFETLLLQFTQSFSNPDEMSQWQTTCNLWVGELRAALEKIRF